MSVETITTTGRGLQPSGSASVNRRADTILDNGQDRLLVLLFDGIWQRSGNGVAWHKQVAAPTFAGISIQPGPPTKRIRFWTDLIDYLPDTVNATINLRYDSTAFGWQRLYYSSGSIPNNYVGFRELTQANIEHDWIIFRGTRGAPAGIVCAQDESRTSVLHEPVRNTKYMICYRPSANRLVAASGDQTTQLSDSVTAESHYDMCSSVVGSSRYYVAALEASGVRLWSCLLYTSPSPRDRQKSRMPSSA